MIRLTVLVFSLFLFIEGCVYVAKSGNLVSDGLRVSMAYPRLSMPVGGALMTLHSVTLILEDILRLRTKKETES